MAFIPAFSGDPKRAGEARDKIRAAREFARRGTASPEMLAWLDAVEAETETRFGDTRKALQLIAPCGGHLREPGAAPVPAVAGLVLPRPAGRIQGQHPADRPAARRCQGDAAARPGQPARRSGQAAVGHPRRPRGRRRRRGRPGRGLPPGAAWRWSNWPAPGTPPAWTASVPSASPYPAGSRSRPSDCLDEQLYDWSTTLHALDAANPRPGRAAPPGSSCASPPHLPCPDGPPGCSPTGRGG